MLKRVLVTAAICGALAAPMAHAQDAAKKSPPAATQGAGNIKRTILQKFDVPGTAYETVTGLAEIVANANIGRHSHFGLESGYVLEGQLVLMVAGQPDRALKAGDSYQIPLGVVHDGKSGPAGAKVIATYVVEKGKPLATPAP